MKWLRGKRGGLIAFLAIAGLVAGGLGWVTAAALRLEQDQAEARAEADLQAKLRQALWQLDSVMMAKLSHEASRPFSHFSGLYAPCNPVDQRGVRCEPGTILEVSPLVAATLPEWILLHFSTSSEAVTDERWWSPQVLSKELQKKLLGIAAVAPEHVSAKARLLEELSKNLRPETILTAVRCEELRQVAIRVQLFEEDGGAAVAKAGGRDQAAAQQKDVQEYQSRAGRLVYGPELPPKQKVKQTTFNTTHIGPLGNGTSWLKPGLREKSREEVVAPGPWTVLWVKTTPGTERLVLARAVSVGQEQVCQGVLLNWESLRQELAAEVKDLFPDARLQPVHLEPPAEHKNAIAFPPHPERTMAALPLELDPGPRPALENLGWTPLRIGLALAWAAALVALAAVGLGGWSLIDLSQRRIRFVSTVTHELRTPLTTLRLYLDMLTGGMVQDEKQKEEYLQTLNAEADRLNRLVSNVLDFSRLENHKPRLHLVPVQVGELLEHVRSTWQTRCKDAGKELLVENALASEQAVVTDVNMVQQLLGNLIDNACKYSRLATDHRLWLRARLDGTQMLFEVEDRGPGVPKGERRSIFRPFCRGREADVIAGGVGLGLALSHRWAALLGGQLTVQPGAADQGACFRLTLAAQKASTPVGEVAASHGCACELHA